MATIGTSVRSAIKVASTSKATAAKRTVFESKIATRGSFFDQASFNLFMEKHQQKQSPKNTAWNSNANLRK